MSDDRPEHRSGTHADPAATGGDPADEHAGVLRTLRELPGPVRVLLFGVAAYVPYGLTSQWGQDFVGRFSAQKASLASVYVQPNVAVELVLSTGPVAPAPTPTPTGSDGALAPSSTTIELPRRSAGRRHSGAE